MRAVLDTNVLLSGLLWHGTPHALMEQVRAGTFSLVISEDLIAELARTITRAKFQTVLARSGIDPQQMLAEIRRLAEIIDPTPLTTPVSRDPADDNVLALAAAAQADLIISGDGDLLVLGTYADIPIITPAQAFAMLQCS